MAILDLLWWRSSSASDNDGATYELPIKISKDVDNLGSLDLLVNWIQVRAQYKPSETRNCLSTQFARNDLKLNTELQRNIVKDGQEKPDVFLFWMNENPRSKPYVFRMAFYVAPELECSVVFGRTDRVGTFCGLPSEFEGSVKYEPPTIRSTPEIERSMHLTTVKRGTAYVPIDKKTAPFKTAKKSRTKASTWYPVRQASSILPVARRAFTFPHLRRKEHLSKLRRNELAVETASTTLSGVKPSSVHHGHAAVSEPALITETEWTFVDRLEDKVSTPLSPEKITIHRQGLVAKSLSGGSSATGRSHTRMSTTSSKSYRRSSSIKTSQTDVEMTIPSSAARFGHMLMTEECEETDDSILPSATTLRDSESALDPTFPSQPMTIAPREFGFPEVSAKQIKPSNSNLPSVESSPAARPPDNEAPDVPQKFCSSCRLKQDQQQKGHKVSNSYTVENDKLRYRMDGYHEDAYASSDGREAETYSEDLTIPLKRFLQHTVNTDGDLGAAAQQNAHISYVPVFLDQQTTYTTPKRRFPAEKKPCNYVPPPDKYWSWDQVVGDYFHIDPDGTTKWRETT